MRKTPYFCESARSVPVTHFCKLSAAQPLNRIICSDNGFSLAQIHKKCDVFIVKFVVFWKPGYDSAIRQSRMSRNGIAPDPCFPGFRSPVLLDDFYKLDFKIQFLPRHFVVCIERDCSLVP